MRINLVAPKPLRLWLILAVACVTLSLYIGIQLHFTAQEILRVHNIAWTYPQPEFEMQIKTTIRDTFWTQFLRLEGLAVKREQGQYRIEGAVVISDAPGWRNFMWDVSGAESLPLHFYRPTRYVKPRDSDILLRAVAVPTEAALAQYGDGPTQIRLNYRFLGLRRTMSTTIHLVHDVRRVAFEQLRGTEQEMVTDWQLGIVDEIAFPPEKETGHRVTLPTRSDAVFEHMAVYVTKYRSMFWKQEDSGTKGIAHGLFIPGERTVRAGQQIFELNVHTDKLEYKTTEKINLYATLKYTGDSKDIVIYSGTPYVIVYIDDGTGPSYAIGLTMMTTVLNQGQIYKYEYPTRFGPSGPKQDLYLPAGEYIVGVLTHFSLTPSSEEYVLPRKTLKIRVTE